VQRGHLTNIWRLVVVLWEFACAACCFVSQGCGAFAAWHCCTSNVVILYLAAIFGVAIPCLGLLLLLLLAVLMLALPFQAWHLTHANNHNKQNTVQKTMNKST